MFEQLMQLPLFQGVSNERMTSLVEKLPFHFLKFHDGDTIISAGDECTHIRFIVSGSVRVNTKFENLNIKLGQTLDSPHVLGAEAMFGINTAYPYTVQSQGTCGILQLLKSDYVKVLQSDKVFLFNILNYLSSNAHRFTHSLLQTRSEFSSLMLYPLVMPMSRDVTLSFKQRDLCHLLGLQRTTFIKRLNTLQEQGLIEWTTNEIKILDPKELTKIL